jgi:aminomethyltransferase
MAESFTSKLDAIHKRLNATMVNVSNWSMPAYYKDGAAQEVLHTRNFASIFDSSYLSKYRISGTAVPEILEEIMVFSTSNLKVQDVQKNYTLTEDGTCLEEWQIIKMAENDFLLIGSSGSADSVADFLSDVVEDYPEDPEILDIANLTGMFAQISIWGSKVKDVFNKLKIDLALLPSSGSSARFEIGMVGCIVIPANVNGLEGFELICNVLKSETLWENLLSVSEVKPAGVKARDILRIEMGIPRCSREYSTARTLEDSGVAIDEESILSSKLIGIKFFDSCSLKPNSTIQDSDATPIGVITSFEVSQSLNTTIALGFIDIEVGITSGDAVVIKSGQGLLKATIVDLPFVK